MKNKFTGNATIQMWLNLKNAEAHSRIILHIPGVFSLGYKDNVFEINGTAITEEVIHPLEYQHLSLVFEALGSSTEVSLYLDGSRVGKTSVNSSLKDPQNIYIGGLYDTDESAENLQKTYFNGYVDEIRLWNYSQTEVEIKKNYDRYLSGKETGLISYYRCDEPSDIKNVLFDLSAEKSKFNMNDALLGDAINKTDDENKVPSADLLSIKGTTDKYGNYLINTVPYSNEGDVFNVTPIYGVHSFSPVSRPVLIGPDSKVHNSIDFTDVSSFSVSGKITYSETNYPVEGVEFVVDGVNICSKDGEIIKSDKDGHYTISVPIGEHHIIARKNGHTFDNKGRYPKDVENAGKKIVFDQTVTGLNFTDNTLVTIAGRVAGGVIEQDKPVGFGIGKANIGQATIVLEGLQDYQLNMGQESKSLNSGNRFVNSTAEVREGSAEITIKTDKESGEFVFMMPPIPLKIVGVSTKKQSSSDFFKDGVFANIEAINPSQTMTDTLTIKGTVEEFEYHHLLDFNYRSAPILEVSDASNRDGAYGDKDVEYIDKAGNKETVTLYDCSKEEPEYLLGKPVFTQLKRYKFELYGYEPYINNDDENDPKEDRGPLDDCLVTIANEFGVQQVYNEGANDGKIYELSENQVQLDSLGTAKYVFTAGFPNILDDHTLDLSINYQHKGASYRWDVPFSAYVIGQLPTGTDFVTQGPDIVSMVLRDPPGSQSSAFFEKGTKISSSHKETNYYSGSGEGKDVIHAGVKVTTGGGIGVVVLSEVESKVDVTIGLEWEVKHSNENGTVNTITTTERISTSDSPDYVGAGGDVFIGSSNNRTFGKARNVGLIKNPLDEKFSFGVEDVITVGTKFATAFKYSANHIENNLIPNFYDIRNNLLIEVDDYDNYLNTTNEPIYITTLKKDDPKFGSDNSDKNVWGDKAALVADEDPKGPSYRVIRPPSTTRSSTDQDSIIADKISWCNSQIAMWKNTLADNEVIKLEAIKNKTNLLNGQKRTENHSFDAGVTFESSKQQCVETSHEKIHEYTIRAIVGAETGIVVGGLGMTASIETKNGGGDTFTDSESTENCITTGYVLKDENSTDYYSVDVITPIDNTGVVFSTRGGRSSCPYEGAVFSKYHAAGSKLSEATVRVEVPSLKVTNPFAVSIPSGKEASYDLKLGNASEANQDVTYSLRVLDETNNGAKLAIEGEVLTTGREFFIKAGETVNKTLKLSQTSSDVLEYKSIALVLSSVCQPEIADTVYISAEFVPACSDVSIVIDRRILNLETDSVLPIKIKDYNLQYKNLEGIQLQYKPINSNTWTLMREFVVKDEKGDKKEPIKSRTEISYEYDSSIWTTDGTYEVRAVTMCRYGEEIINNESQTIRIVKDMTPPQSLGQPSPSNGILVPESELSITFNEPIQNNLLGEGNFVIEGVLNGYKVSENVGLGFDGTGNAYTELQVVNNSSLSIEGWFKRQLNTSGTLFSYGTHDNSISLNFTDDNKLSVTAGDQVFTAQDELRDAGWQYISMTYNRFNGNIRVNLLTSQENITPSILGTDKFAAKELPQTGRFYLGSKIDGSDPFKGLLRQVHFWNKERKLSDLSDRNAGKGGNENGLVGYWNLEEGSGNLAADKARARNLTVNTGWFIYPATKAVSFNGIDDYLKLSNEQVIFTPEDDFSIEFWFKGEKQDGVIFSAGDAVKDKVDGKFAIASNKEGQLLMRTSGEEYTIASSDVMNNEWHHFAISVRRQGNANVYIDGTQTYQLSAKQVNGYSTAYTYLGAGFIEEQTSGSETTIVVDSPFAGMLDELRIWNTSLTSDNLKLDRNNKLTGKESGLVAYYPFEKYIKDDNEQLVIKESLDDQSMKLYANTVIPSSLVADGKVAFIDATPAIKNVRPKETITQYTRIASENKIVLNLDVPISRIENCILEFTVQRVMDNNNNRMSPKKWTAFIDLNRLQWEKENLSFEKNIYDPLSFKATISNKGGVNESYSISNIPSWLTCSSANGTLKPQQTQEIEFVVDKSVEIGKYEIALMLSGNNNYLEPMVLSLKVNGEKPNWSVNPNDYSSSMNIVSQLKIENVYQEDTEDIVAAFIDGECRGVGSPQYVKNFNNYYLFMNIYGNESDKDKEIVFQLWDASKGRIYTDMSVNEQIIFDEDLTLGKFTDPVILNALDIIEQQINLKQGWNWISANTVARETSLLEIFKKNIGEAGEMLKSKKSYIQAPTWSGDLTEIRNEEMYNLRTKNAHVLKFKGAVADPSEHPISLTKGWNWIGYIPSFSLPVNSALAGIEAKDGDQIKGQSGFALYVEGDGWFGDLEYMTPGKGYMYYRTDQSATLVYPSKMMQNTSFKQTKSAPLHWEANINRYQSNMTLTSVVLIDGVEMKDTDLEIALFSGNECRGTARLNYEESLGTYLAYLLVQGESMEDLNFKVYSHATQKSYECKETIAFKANAIYGNPINPYAINLENITVGIETEHMPYSINLYPNPTSNFLNINGLRLGCRYKYVIYGMDGRVVLSGFVNKSDDKINVSDLTPAPYIFEISSTDSLAKHRISFIKE